MAYQIAYMEKTAKKKRIISIPKLHVKRMHLLGIACVLLCFMLVAACVSSGFRIFLADLILPGDSAVTAAALEEMVQDFSAGQPLQTVLTDFCRNILEGA